MMATICKGYDHITIGVSDLKKSGKFYDRLLIYLGFKCVLHDDESMGWSNGPNAFWIYQVVKNYSNNGFHRKNIGLNHIAFRASSKKAVDEFYKKFLLNNNIHVLYNGPKAYPEYHKSYYVVYFEDPDRIKIEFMYIH